MTAPIVLDIARHWKLQQYRASLRGSFSASHAFEYHVRDARSLASKRLHTVLMGTYV
jgi:hypothetical protein